MFFFFFNDTATTEIYTLSLHDALPISQIYQRMGERAKAADHYSRFIDLWKDCDPELRPIVADAKARLTRSEEHTSELQSQSNLVCRLLLEKKKKTNITY